MYHVSGDMNVSHTKLVYSTVVAYNGKFEHAGCFAQGNLNSSCRWDRVKHSHPPFRFSDQTKPSLWPLAYQPPSASPHLTWTKSGPRKPISPLHTFSLCFQTWHFLFTEAFWSLPLILHSPFIYRQKWNTDKENSRSKSRLNQMCISSNVAYF